jgi:hypothetical protein
MQSAGSSHESIMEHKMAQGVAAERVANTLEVIGMRADLRLVRMEVLAGVEEELSLSRGREGAVRKRLRAVQVYITRTLGAWD